MGTSQEWLSGLQRANNGRSHFQEATGYLKCACTMSILERAKEDIYLAFVNGHCIDQPFTAEHAGHPSQRPWQTGLHIHCLSCGQAHVDLEQRLILTTAALRKECNGAAARGFTSIQDPGLVPTATATNVAAAASQQPAQEDPHQTTRAGLDSGQHEPPIYSVQAPRSSSMQRLGRHFLRAWR